MNKKNSKNGEALSKDRCDDLDNIENEEDPAAKFVYDFAKKDNQKSSLMQNGLHPMQYILGILSFAECNVDELNVENDEEREELKSIQTELRRTILNSNPDNASERIKAIKEELQEILTVRKKY